MEDNIPSLFDNNPLRIGIRELNEFHFHESICSLENALHVEIDQQLAQQVYNTALYWKKRVMDTLIFIPIFQEDLDSYRFPRQLFPFKAQLVSFLFSRIKAASFSEKKYSFVALICYWRRINRKKQEKSLISYGKRIHRIFPFILFKLKSSGDNKR